MIKNRVNETKYLKAENLKKIENYLKLPINFDPNLTMTQIIKNVINKQSINTKTSKNSRNKKVTLRLHHNLKNNKIEKLIIKKNLNFHPQRKEKNIKKNEIKTLKKSNSSPNIDLSSYQNDLRIINLGNKFGYLEDKKDLNIIINNLENELKKIKTDKINKLEENNKFNDNKIYLIKSFEDNNKFVPNLCLSSKGFSEIYKNNINKFNNKIKSIWAKNEKIKKINRRMYYDSKQNKNLKEFDLSDIRKYHKITELVVLNRGKQKLLNRKIRNLKFEENIKK